MPVDYKGETPLGSRKKWKVTGKDRVFFFSEVDSGGGARNCMHVNVNLKGFAVVRWSQVKVENVGFVSGSNYYFTKVDTARRLC